MLAEILARWVLLDAYVGNKCAIRSKDDMERIILSAMKMIQGKTDLIKSFFKLPDTNYAQDVLIVYFIYSGYTLKQGIYTFCHNINV